MCCVDRLKSQPEAVIHKQEKPGTKPGLLKNDLGVG